MRDFARKVSGIPVVSFALTESLISLAKRTGDEKKQKNNISHFLHSMTAPKARRGFSKGGIDVTISHSRFPLWQFFSTSLREVAYFFLLAKKKYI